MMRIGEIIATKREMFASGTPLASFGSLRARSRSGAVSRGLSLRFSTSEKSSTICSWRSDSHATRLRDTPLVHSIGEYTLTGLVASDLRASSLRTRDDESGDKRRGAT